MVQIFGRHRGKVVLPFWFRVVRGVQVMLAIIILGLAGYGISVDGAQVLRPALILALITAIFTILPIVPLTFPLAGSRGVFHPVGSLALDSIGMILWLASLTALASYTRIYSGIRHFGGGEYFGYSYNASSVATAWRCGVAAAVFAAFELLVFLATLLFFAYSYHHHVAGTQPSGPLFRTSGFGTASVTKDEEHAMTDTAPTSPSTTHAVPHGMAASTANGEPSAAATNPPYPTGNAYEVPPPPLPTGPARDSAVSPLHTGHHAPPPQIPPVQTFGPQDSIRFDQQPQPQQEQAAKAPKTKGRYVYQPVYVPPEQLLRHDSKTNIQALPSQPQRCSCHGGGAAMEGSADVRVESTSNVTTPTATLLVSTPSLAVHPPLPLTPDETTSNGGDHYPTGISNDVLPTPRSQAPAPQQQFRRLSLVPLRQQQTEPPSIFYQEPPPQQRQTQRQERPPPMPNHARSLTLSPHTTVPPKNHHPRSLSITHPLAPQPPSRSVSPENHSSQSLSPYSSRPGMPYRSLSALSSPTASSRPKSPSPNPSTTSISPYAPLEHPFSPKPPGHHRSNSNAHVALSPRIALVQRRTTSASSVATLSRFHSVDERDEATGLPRAPPGVDFEASGALAVGANRGKKRAKDGDEAVEEEEEERRSGEWSGEVEVEGVPRGVEWMVCRT